MAGRAKIAGVAAASTLAGLVAYSGFSARRAERRSPADGRFVRVQGARLHYVDIGEGPAIVLVHGLGGQLRNFTYALTERLLPDFRVIVVDRPGSGYSTLDRDGPRTLAGQAAILSRFIEALKLDRPLVVGHSLGGALALAVALERPELVGGLALLAPLTQPVDAIPEAFKALLIRSPTLRLAIAWTLVAPLGRLAKGRARTLIFGPDPLPAGLDDCGGGALMLRPGAFVTASLEVCVGTEELIDAVRRYPSLVPPLGILFGRDDRVLPPAVHGRQTAAMVPGAEYEEIAGGHMIPMTMPDETAAFIRRQAARIG